MKSIKNILKVSLIVLLLFLTSSLLITIFNYFNILNYKVINILKIITIILSFTIGGYLIGKKATKNGWLEGIKISSLMSFLLTILTILLDKFKISYLVYISVLIISSILGSIFGINKK